MTETAHSGMWGRTGDRVVIRHRRVGEKDRDGEILEALGEEGGPPFVVRWSDDGHVSRLYPGSDAYVAHFEPPCTEHDGR